MEYFGSRPVPDELERPIISLLSVLLVWSGERDELQNPEIVGVQRRGLVYKSLMLVYIRSKDVYVHKCMYRKAEINETGREGHHQS